MNDQKQKQLGKILWNVADQLRGAMAADDFRDYMLSFLFLRYLSDIELDAWLTDVLRGRRWHPSQSWTELPGGGSRLRLRLSCLEEIEQWVLSWGTRATVIRPMELRDRLLKTTEELWQRYGGPMVLHDGRASANRTGNYLNPAIFELPCGRAATFNS